VLCFSVALAQQPVIPGASGYGINTPAGRGGTLIRVTNLGDSGTGSLRECVNTSGPRICVFEVSGIIWLDTNLTIRNSNITIAGQTAPPPGITLAGAALAPKASDVLVQHLAIRAGDQNSGPAPEVRDTLKIETADPIQNIVIDHCSISWSIDENISTFKSWSNVTISNSIISEGLRDSLHPKGEHAYGALIDTDNAKSSISLVGNLCSAGVMLYNDRGLTTKNSIVGNVFVDGPNTRATPIRLLGPADGVGILRGSKVYLDDNVASGATSDPWSIVLNRSDLTQSDLSASTAPSWPQGLSALSTAGGAVLERVLANAGSRPSQRDSVDKRVISDVINKTGDFVNCVGYDGSSRCSKNAGGWPDHEKNVRRLTLPVDPNGDDDKDGYSNVEEWLHSMAAEVEGRSGEQVVRPLPPTLSQL
jgi:hypothetical protein